MKDYYDFDKLIITIKESKINSIINKSTGDFLKSFPNRISKNNIPKIYVIKENNFFLYIGVTTQSLTSRFRYGLKADGKKGYHGYKWKIKKSVELYVWCFEGKNKIEIENIEAELVSHKNQNRKMANKSK